MLLIIDVSTSSDPALPSSELPRQRETSPSNAPQGPEGGAEPNGRSQMAVMKKTFGGYDYEFVEPPTSIFQTECSICSLVLRDPHLAKCCGTSFCCTCCERIQAEHKSCPTCRDENFEVFPNKGLKRSLDQLHVLCTHSKDGCKWTGELRELEHHLNEAVHSGKSLQCEDVPDWSYFIRKIIAVLHLLYMISLTVYVQQFGQSFST